jgi:hypothetical protein
MIIFTIPTIPMALLIAVLSTLLALAGLYLFRRLGLQPTLTQNNPVTGSIYTILGGLYGIFLAFTIIIAWGQFLNAKRSVYKEVTYLSELWRDAQVFPDSARKQIQERIIAYAVAVVDFEWESMALKGEASPVTESAYQDIWQSYYELKPQGTQEEIFYHISIGLLNEVGKHRRERIMESRSKLPHPMWIFLVCGGFLTIFFTYLFGARYLWLQGIAIALLAWLVGFSLFLVLSLQYPFTGDISIKPLPFQELVLSFKHRMELHPYQLRRQR